MSLTDEQKELLGLLVSNYKTEGDAEFYLTKNVDGWWISYAVGGPFFRVQYSDLEELRNERLIRLVAKGSCFRGWPTKSGISAVQLTNTVDGPAKTYKTALGRNIDRIRKECGWSFDDLATATELDKKLILGHVNYGKGCHPKTLRAYAAAFSEKLGRPVSVAEIEG